MISRPESQDMTMQAGMGGTKKESMAIKLYMVPKSVVQDASTRTPVPTAM